MVFKQRKPTRLKDFNYGQEGSYFVTICTHNKMNILSYIDKKQDLETATVQLSPIGQIAESCLLDLEERFPNIKIDTYVIMPNHIHAIISIQDASIPNPKELSDLICTYKSLVTKIVKRHHTIDKLFQRSYYDHIIRNEKDYQNTFSYILRNPGKWLEDKYYSSQ